MSRSARRERRPLATPGDLARLHERGLLRSPPGSVRTQQDRKQAFRRLLRELGGVPQDELAREFKALLLSDGWAGLCDHIGTTLARSPELSGHKALAELTGYLAARTGRLNYTHRLHTGRSIGSGMVEGAAKNLIGRRLKQTGALGRGQRRCDGRPLQPELQRPPGPLLGLTQPNARIHWRTPHSPWLGWG